MEFSTCSRCSLPLKLDTSLMSSSSFDMLASQLPIVRESLPSQLPPVLAAASKHDPIRKSVRSSKKEDAPLSQTLSTTQGLCQLLSDSTNIDHPLCIDCADQLQDILTARLADIKADRERLQSYEREVIQNAPTLNEIAKLEEEIKELQNEEDLVKQELLDAEKEQALLDQQLEELAEEERQLAEEEQQFWVDYSEYEERLRSLQSELAVVKRACEHDERELAKLQNTNVYNDVFCIGHEGGIATINGLRLGRLPNVQVDWPEVNAAWGHTVLLAYTIARKWDLTFDTYRLIPMASFSKVEVLADKSILELYGSGDFAIGRFLLNRRFEQAMVAFLECLKQLMAVAKKQDPAIRLPFLISKDLIGDVSIKIQLSNYQNWTRALRHVLLTLKIILVSASAADV